MINTVPVEERLEIKKKTHKNMMWLAISSICMMFIGLSSAYIIAKADITWIHITMPDAFFTSSIVIFASSITFWLAVRFAKKEQKKTSLILVLVTLFLGFGFVKFQLDGWAELNEKGMFFVDVQNVNGLIASGKGTYGADYTVIDSGTELKYVDGKFYDARDDYNTTEKIPNLATKNNASSYLYLLTGLHIVHLLGGLISLIFVTVKSLGGKYSKEDTVGIEVSSLYWHFLDILWLYLFALLYFVG
jgi:cytochrome c oxidase subunit 3